MDDRATLTQAVDVDYERLLALDLEKARAARDELARVAERDAERLHTIRTSLDTFATALWSTIEVDHRAFTDRSNLSGAFALRGMDTAREGAFGALALLVAWQFFGFNALLLAGTVIAYAALVVVDFGLLRRKSQRALRSMRDALGRDGRDVRFFACTRLERGNEYPFIGLEGPLDDGALRERKWMISGLNERDALHEPFLELLDPRARPVVLSRFPDKTPMIVQADATNRFISAFGGYVQHAFEVQLPTLRRAGEEFREIVARTAKLQSAEDRVLALEAELEDAFRSRAAWTSIVLEPELEDDLCARAALFRLEEAQGAPMSLLLTGPPGTGKSLVAQALARASGAAFIPFELPETKSGAVDMRAYHVKDAFDAARTERSLLFVDRCDAYFGENGSVSDEITEAFVREWDDPKNAHIWIVAETSHPERLHPEIVRKFESEIVMPLPDATARERLLKQVAKRYAPGLAFGDELIAATDGMSGRDLEELLASANEDAGDGPVTGDSLLEFLLRRKGLVAALAGSEIERGVLVHGGTPAAAFDFVRQLARDRGLPLVTVTSPDQVLPFEAGVVFLVGASSFGDHADALHPGQALVAAVADPEALDEGVRTRFGLTVTIPPLVASDEPPFARSA